MNADESPLPDDSTSTAESEERLEDLDNLANEAVAWVLPAEPIESVTTPLIDETPIAAVLTEVVDPSVNRVVAPVTDPETVEALRKLSERIDRKFADLQSAFEREGRAEASREKVIDRLHAELQEYKQDLLLNTLRPIFIVLIQLHDDIGKVAVVPAEPSEETSRFVALMVGFQEGIEDILYRQGVEPYRNEGDIFDARRQRAVATVPTDDPALAKTIAARHRKGFQSGDRVIRAEIVSVHAVKK